jgi:hypothetical protein
MLTFAYKLKEKYRSEPLDISCEQLSKQTAPSPLAPTQK